MQRTVMLIEGCKTISASPSKATAKVQLFWDMCKFSDKKAVYSDVSRSCGIIHGYARIRNPRLPRFLFGGESHMCKGKSKKALWGALFYVKTLNC